MIRRKLYLALLLLLVCGTAVVLFQRIASRIDQTPEKPADSKLDSINLHYLLFDKENRKSMEIWARESQRGGKGESLLKGVSAIIYKKGKMSEDIKVEADEGVATPNFSEFEIRKNARIHSPRLDLEGDYFKVINNEMIATSEPTRFRFEDQSGIAQRGLGVFFRVKDLRVHSAEGKITIAGKEYEHKERELTLFHDIRTLNLDDVEYFRNAETMSRAERFQFEFNDDLSLLKRALTIKDSYFFSVVRRPDGSLAQRELRADISESTYDSRGRLDTMTFRGGGSTFEVNAKLTAGKKSTEIVGPLLSMIYNPDDGRLQTVEASVSTVTYQGREKFRFFCQKMTMKLTSKGDLDNFLGQYSCRSEWESIKATSHTIYFQEAKALLALNGSPAKVEKEGSTFESDEFLIRTRSRLLGTDSGVKSVMAARPKQRSQFYQKPAFITSKKMEMRERTSDLLFQEKVKLIQGDTQILAERLRVLQQADQSQMQASGKVACVFKNGKDLFRLEADNLQLVAAENMIEASGGADLSSPTDRQKLRADRIRIRFGKDDQIESVSGFGRVSFSAPSVEGSCELFEWNYVQGQAVFRRSSRLTQKGVTTTGEELRVNLKEDEIVGRPRRRDCPGEMHP